MLFRSASSSVPTNYEPDPALQRASRGELEARVRKACVIVQARLQNASETALSRLPEQSVCRACFTRSYPTRVPEERNLAKLRFEPAHR